MNVASILSTKGATVEVVGPETLASVAVHRMASRSIGCLVVVGPDDELLGVLGERDVVRAMDRHGEALPRLRVKEMMVKHPPTCTVGDDLSEVLRRMTSTRQRHLPVVSDGRLVGLVSIGDVVKQRLDALELETHVLRDVYLSRG